jgi:hypothetical protein
MPYFLLIFAAGILVGKKWDAIRRAVAPVTGAATAKFDAMYADAARTVGTKIEEFEDRVAEARQRSRANGA